MKVWGYKRKSLVDDKESISWWPPGVLIRGIDSYDVRHDFEGEVVNIVPITHPPCEHKSAYHNSMIGSYRCTTCGLLVQPSGYKPVPDEK